MVCPACRGTDQVVLETRDRTDDAGDYTLRRRRCETCDHRWTTEERVEEAPPDHEQTRRPSDPLGPPPGLTGADVRRRRLFLEVSQPQVAKLANVSISTLAQIERPRPARLTASVTRVLWLRVDDVLTRLEAERALALSWAIAEKATRP